MRNNLVIVEAVHTHTHTDVSLKNRIVVITCNCFIAGSIFGTQNLIRDG